MSYLQYSTMTLRPPVILSAAFYAYCKPYESSPAHQVSIMKHSHPACIGRWSMTEE